MKSRAILGVMLSLVLVTLVLVPVCAHAEDMVKLRGRYGASMGFETDEFIWKNASGDYQEKNFRYIDMFDNVNTYDKRIFDRYELEIQTDTGTPWNGYAEIVVDPWSFVGKSYQTISNAWGDQVDVEYKYWANTGKTINETYRTAFGNVVFLPESKVIGGRVTSQTAAPQIIWAPPEPNFTNFSANRSAEIEYMFRPLRKLWVEYKKEPFYMKFFPISDMHEALTSDDPLRLSNNKVYWAPSPWLWAFDPGAVILSAPNRTLQSAKWNWDLAWYAEDTNRRYLTFLRGMTVGYTYKDIASIDVTAATPMSLWDDFGECNSIPIAARFKLRPAPAVQFGSIYTSKYGIYKKDLRASNDVLGFDITYNLGEDTHLFGEYAGSRLDIQEADDSHAATTGYAYTMGVTSKNERESNKYTWEAKFTHMSRDFAPGLSDYRDTRIDRDWGRHIWFDPIPSEDEAIRIGDSVDVNRYVLGLNARASWADELFIAYLNLRNAHNSYNDKFIENVTRVEAVYNPLAHVQFKGLILHRHRPLASGGLDPWLYDRYYDNPYPNPQVQDGECADLMTFSGGAKVDFWDGKATVFGIYEATNDPQEFPRRELNFPYAYTRTVNDLALNDISNNLYGQGLFGLPPYDFYNIWKGVVIMRPNEKVTIRYTHVTNGNHNYASLLDDNHAHDSIELTLRLFKKLTIRAGYSISRVDDLRRAIDTLGQDRKYEDHHNVYAQAKYDMNKDHNLIVQYGEFGLLQEDLGVFGAIDPGMGYLTSRQGVLDTRPILRVFYQGKF